MIGSVLTAVNTYFADNWVDSDIHQNNTQKHPTADNWIHLDVEPINVIAGLSACVQETHSVYVTCYARNSIQAAQLADKVIVFLQWVKMGELTVKSWKPLHKGEIHQGSYFYKIAFDAFLVE